jgi:outer membrane protein assembly factor BamB
MLASILHDPNRRRARSSALKCIIGRSALVIIILSLAACTNGGGPVWSQYRGDAANSGSVLLPTGVAERPEWRIEVGPGLYAGPVIGAEGVIYLGQRGQGLLAVNANASVLWTAPLTGVEGESRILSTPAVAEDGSIYIIITDYESEVSTLHKVSPNGAELWVVALPQPSMSSPTVWEELVFIAAYDEVSGAIFVVDSDGNLRLDQSQETSDPCKVVGESLMGQMFGTLKDFFDDFPPGVEWDGSSQVAKPPPSLQPTVTVVDEDTVGELSDPVVIVPQVCSVLFYEWTGSGFVRLEHDIFADGEPRRFTSAAVSPSGRVIVGAEDGRVRSYVIDPTISPTGTAWDWTKNLGQPVRLEPAVTRLPAVKEIFVAAAGRVWALSADGEDLDSIDLIATVTTPPVVSKDHVFVGTEDGLITLSWDLAILGEVDEVKPWLYRSPAIGEDGAVVLAEADGLVRFGEP